MREVILLLKKYKRRIIEHKKARNLYEIRLFTACRERGIRTPGTLAGSTVFKTAAFDRSAISLGQSRTAKVL
jgi:hypothetical protein